MENNDLNVIANILNDVWSTAMLYGNTTSQKRLTIDAKALELTEFLASRGILLDEGKLINVSEASLRPLIERFIALEDGVEWVVGYGGAYSDLVDKLQKLFDDCVEALE